MGPESRVSSSGGACCATELTGASTSAASAATTRLNGVTVLMPHRTGRRSRPLESPCVNAIPHAPLTCCAPGAVPVREQSITPSDLGGVLLRLVGAESARDVVRQRAGVVERAGVQPHARGTDREGDLHRAGEHVLPETAAVVLLAESEEFDLAGPAVVPVEVVEPRLLKIGRASCRERGWI